MKENVDGFDEEVEKMEKESKSKVKSDGQKKITEKYKAFYQEQRIGIMDTLNKQIIIEGLPDVTTAELEALKLNKLDQIGIVSGVD